jgi:presenilin-like A22 family membrane protease
MSNNNPNTSIVITSLVVQVMILAALIFILFLVARERKTIKKIISGFISTAMGK